MAEEEDEDELTGGQRTADVPIVVMKLGVQLSSQNLI